MQPASWPNLMVIQLSFGHSICPFPLPLPPSYPPSPTIFPPPKSQTLSIGMGGLVNVNKEVADLLTRNVWIINADLELELETVMTI